MTIKTHGRMVTDNSISITQLNVTDGTDGQVLETDGSGTLSFASIPILSLEDNSVTGAKIAMGSDAAGDILYYNGTDYVRLAKGTASQHLATNAGATAPEWVTPTTYATEAYADAAGSGKVLQVKSHHVTTIASISVSAHTWTDVGVSLAITPSSTGSKIWVTGNLSMGHNGYGGMRILRDSTAVVSSTSTPGLRAPTHAGSQASSGNLYELMQSTANAVDAPSTTSAITYKYQWWHNDTITIYRNRESSDSNHANRTYAVSTITLIELEDSTITTA